MAEASEEYLVRKMSRAEVRELSDVDKKERSRLLKCIRSKKYREEYPEKVKEQKEKHREKYPEKQKERDRKYIEKYPEKKKERDRKYREENKEKKKEYFKEYRQTPNGKKSQTLSSWKSIGLQESPEDLYRIYELWQTQELCNACDCVLTRDGDRSSTDATMDHCHITHRFRHIICRSCNTQDRWMQYFC